ncbi:hypothetical protein P40081_02650 [Paenibacillus sp. FSL P4-0081]|nr:hypothetical protein P40081_02650 [Paenibacillus sp. FSL P4-0081]OMF29730.1 hypothetical protein BK132_11915 [Paenibacillus sp. FSL H8-0259]
MKKMNRNEADGIDSKADSARVETLLLEAVYCTIYSRCRLNPPQKNGNQMYEIQQNDVQGIIKQFLMQEVQSFRNCIGSRGCLEQTCRNRATKAYINKLLGGLKHEPLLFRFR